MNKGGIACGDKFMKYSKRTIKKENENRSLFLFLLYSLCFMLYTLQIISASQKLFANTKLPEDILQQIVIRYLPRNLT